MKPIASSHSAGLGYFHLARGLGMVLILLGHSMTPFFSVSENGGGLFSGAGSVLGGGIMAMFFVISGFGFYSRSHRKCLATQYKLLLKPYFITTAAVLVTKVILAVLEQRPFANHGADLVLTYVLGLNAEGGGVLWGMPINSVSIMWFVLALFGGWVLYNSISRLKSGKLRAVLIIACVTAGWGLTTISKVWPWCLPMGLLAVGYLAAGREISRRNLLTRKLPVWCWVAVWGITLCCAAWGRVNMVACRWGMGLLDVAGSFCVGFLLLRGYHVLMQNNLHGWPVRFLEAVGFYSLWIVFLHGYEKVIFPWYQLKSLFPENLVLCTIVCLVLRSCIIYGMMRLVMWIRRILRKKRAGSVRNAQ